VPYSQWDDSKTNIAQYHYELARLSLSLLATRRRERPLQDWELVDNLNIIVSMAALAKGKYLNLLTAANKHELSLSLLQPPEYYYQKDFYEILLSHGADVNFVPDTDSQLGPHGTPLIGAVSESPANNTNGTEVIALLLSKGASVNLEAKVGVYRTALIAACARNRIGAAKQLLKKGARILPQPGQSQENNALHWAVEISSVALVRQLWRRLPDLNFYQGAKDVIKVAKEKLLQSNQTALAKGLILHLLGGSDDGVSKDALEEVQFLFGEGNISSDLRERAMNLSKRLGYMNPDTAMVNGFQTIIEHCGRKVVWNEVRDIWTNYLDLLDEYEELDEQKRVPKADELESNGKFKLKRSNSDKTDKYGSLYLSDEEDDEWEDNDDIEGTDEEDAADA